MSFPPPSDRLNADRTRAEHGASMVEFALILPVVVMLTFGMLTGGLAYHRQLSLTHAAREAARFGATYPADDLDVLVNIVADRAEDSAHGELDAGVEGRGICVAYVSGGGTQKIVRGEDLTAGDAPAGQCFSDDRVAEPRIQVRVGRDTEFLAIFFNTTIDLRSDALSRHEITPMGS